MSNHAKRDISPKKEEKSSEVTKMLKEKKIEVTKATNIEGAIRMRLNSEEDVAVTTRTLQQIRIPYHV